MNSFNWWVISLLLWFNSFIRDLLFGLKSWKTPNDLHFLFLFLIMQEWMSYKLFSASKYHSEISILFFPYVKLFWRVKNEEILLFELIKHLRTFVYYFFSMHILLFENRRIILNKSKSINSYRFASLLGIIWVLN